MDDSGTAALRNALVDELKTEGYVNSPNVEDALRNVPRHLFIPWRKPEDGYRGTEGAIVDPDTTPETCSTVSQPIAVAMMLEGFDVKPGMRVLEIGAGSGYNAALLACLTGDSGHVVTVDVEDFLVNKARRQLSAIGFEQVEVVCGDGALGCPSSAPYDRIVVTVGLPDVPPAWIEQLAPGGKIVIPLHLGIESHQCVLVSLEPKDGLLKGVGLGSLDMVLFRSEAARYSREITRRWGGTWQGAKTDELKATVYPKGADVPLEPQQLQIKKRSSLTVLEHGVRVE